MCPSVAGSGGATQEGPESPPGFDALEEAIARALRQLDVWRRRAHAADAERRQLKAVMEESRAAGDDPTRLAHELVRLREENVGLRTRLAEARARAEQIEKRLLFLEDARS